MRRFWLVALGIVTACVQLALHGLSVLAVVPGIAIVVLVIVASRNSFADSLWFALPLGLVLEAGSVLTFGTQLLVMLIFVMTTKLLLRATPDRPQGVYLLALLICATWAMNLILILSLPFEVVSGNSTRFLLRIGLETLYNSVLLGVWLAVSQRTEQKAPGYRLPTTK